MKLNHKFHLALSAVILLFVSVGYITASSKPATDNSKVTGDDKQINFIENSWSTALKKAKAENKYIFVDAYASWCGPCKLLKATTFKNNQAAAFFNKNFINVSIDMEKGEGPGLASEWGIRAYPTLIIFDPQGKPVLGTVGFINAKDLIKFGQQALQKK